MSTQYADRKTREILLKVNGQKKLAEQAILALAMRDPAFLQSLVEPYLGGIVLHAIERARKSSGVAEPRPLPKAAAAKSKPPSRPAGAPPAKVGVGALDAMMNAWAKSFEQSAPTPAEGNKAGAKKVSANHLAAMQALIKKK